MKAGLPRLLFISIIFLSLVSCPTEGVPRAVQNVEVNRELYERTFNEILQFIKTMDEIIAAKDFVKWKEKCTPGYLAFNSNPERLKELSQKPSLKDNQIVLNSLEDYFFRVFVPSRIKAPLDKIEFIEKNRVKAVTVIDGIPYIVYLLEKDDNNEWKIGVW